MVSEVLAALKPTQALTSHITSSILWIFQKIWGSSVFKHMKGHIYLLSVYQTERQK